MNLKVIIQTSPLPFLFSFSIPKDRNQSLWVSPLKDYLKTSEDIESQEHMIDI